MNLRHQLNAVQEMPMQFHMVHFRHTSIKSSILRFFICLAKVSNPKNSKLHLPIGGSLYTGMVKGIGRENQGLYVLKDKTVTPSQQYSPYSCASFVKQGSDSSILWHKRLGHAPLEVIKKHESFKHLVPENHLSRSSSKSSFDMLHCDIWGPYRVPSHNNKRVYTPCNIPYPRNTRDGNGAGRGGFKAMQGGTGLRLCGAGGMWGGLKLIFFKLMCGGVGCGYM
ncbi:hypothetical protein KY285_022298 [Solanum tuberosum]|nr:hypothetical protein KY285_022298 [Solanum tuberosum]